MITSMQCYAGITPMLFLHAGTADTRRLEHYEGR